MQVRTYLFTVPCYVQVNHLGGWSNDLKDYSTPQGHEGPQRRSFVFFGFFGLNPMNPINPMNPRNSTPVVSFVVQ
jgi:hypothetical protein